MKIIGGIHRGRGLVAPAGLETRPTAGRARQVLFDVLSHAAWAGRGALHDARVLDAFAGSGALGLEALSRGAAHAVFMETAPGARAAIRSNMATIGEQQRCTVLAADATRPPPAQAPCSIAFLDPPYRNGLLQMALPALAMAGWFAPGALLCLELARDETLAFGEPLTDRTHGAARLVVLRAA